MTRQEVLVVFYEEETPVAVLRQNGTSEFFHLRKMNKDAVAQLLGVEQEK